MRLGELVWVADYAAAARERGLARAKEVAEANARAEEMSGQAQLTELVQSGLGEVV